MGPGNEWQPLAYYRRHRGQLEQPVPDRLQPGPVIRLCAAGPLERSRYADRRQGRLGREPPPHPSYSLRTIYSYELVEPVVCPLAARLRSEQTGRLYAEPAYQ